MLKQENLIFGGEKYVLEKIKDESQSMASKCDVSCEKNILKQCFFKIVNAVFFIFTNVLLFVSCDEEYPFEDLSHVFYLNLKGNVREIRISAEISDYNKSKYTVFKRANLANSCIPQTIPAQKYLFSDNMFGLFEFKNINMYIMSISELYYPFLNRASDIAISFDDRGRIVDYKVYDLKELVFECNFNYEKSILKSINKKYLFGDYKNWTKDFRGRCAEYVLNNNDSLVYYKQEDREIKFEYFDNKYLKQRIDRLSNTDSILNCYNFEYVQRGGMLVQTMDLNINEVMRRGHWKDSLYIFLDKQNKAYKSIYFSNYFFKTETYNILFEEGKIVNILPSFGERKYDNEGRITHFNNFDIKYDDFSDLVKSIRYKVYKDFDIIYTCKYEYDIHGNWINLEIEPDDKNYYDELLEVIRIKKKKIDELNSILENYKFSETYLQLMKEEQELAFFEKLQVRLYEAYFKLIIKRDINYYK